MSSDFQNVISSLSHLSETELREISQRIKALSSLNGGVVSERVVNTSADIDTDLFLDVIVFFMQSKGLEFTSVSMLKKSSQYRRSFQDKIPEVMRYLEHGAKSRIGRRALLLIAVELLYENLMEMGIVATSRTLMSHAHRIPGVLNRSFPGYARSGMLHMIVERKP